MHEAVNAPLNPADPEQVAQVGQILPGQTPELPIADQGTPVTATEPTEAVWLSAADRRRYAKAAALSFEDIKQKGISELAEAVSLSPSEIHNNGGKALVLEIAADAKVKSGAMDQEVARRQARRDEQIRVRVAAEQEEARLRAATEAREVRRRAVEEHNAAWQRELEASRQAQQQKREEQEWTQRVASLGMDAAKTHTVSELSALLKVSQADIYKQGKLAMLSKAVDEAKAKLAATEPEHNFYPVKRDKAGERYSSEMAVALRDWQRQFNAVTAPATEKAHAGDATTEEPAADAVAFWDSFSEAPAEAADEEPVVEEAAVVPEVVETPAEPESTPLPEEGDVIPVGGFDDELFEESETPVEDHPEPEPEPAAAEKLVALDDYKQLKKTLARLESYITYEMDRLGNGNKAAQAVLGTATEPSEYFKKFFERVHDFAKRVLPDEEQRMPLLEQFNQAYKELLYKFAPELKAQWEAEAAVAEEEPVLSPDEAVDTATETPEPADDGLVDPQTSIIEAPAVEGPTEPAAPEPTPEEAEKALAFQAVQDARDSVREAVARRKEQAATTGETTNDTLIVADLYAGEYENFVRVSGTEDLRAFRDSVRFKGWLLAFSEAAIDHFGLTEEALEDETTRVKFESRIRKALDKIEGEALSTPTRG